MMVAYEGRAFVKRHRGEMATGQDVSDNKLRREPNAPSADVLVGDEHIPQRPREFYASGQQTDCVASCADRKRDAY
jgi:hypothetical protein